MEFILFVCLFVCYEYILLLFNVQVFFLMTNFGVEFKYDNM